MFTDRVAALKYAKVYRGARFKSFTNKEQALEFVECDAHLNRSFLSFTEETEPNKDANELSGGFI